MESVEVSGASAKRKWCVDAWLFLILVGGYGVFAVFRFDSFQTHLLPHAPPMTTPSTLSFTQTILVSLSLLMMDWLLQDSEDRTTAAPRSLLPEKRILAMAAGSDGREECSSA